MGVVVGFRPDLLGGRLLNFAFGWSFAERHGLPFVLAWANFDKFAAQSGYSGRVQKFSDLFAYGDFILSAEQSRFVLAENIALGRARDLIGAGFTDIVAVPGYRKDGRLPSDVDQILSRAPELIYSLVDPVFPEGGSRHAETEHARSLLLRIGLSAAVQSAVEEVRGAIDLADAVSVHVRRGDIVTDLRDSPFSADLNRKRIENFVRRYIPLRTYTGFLQGRAEPKPVAVFSDDPGAAEKISAILGREVLDASSLIAGLGFLTKIQRDLTEMVVMSRTSAIACGGSRFAKFAAFYGDAPLTDLAGRISQAELADELAVIGLGPGHPRHSEIMTTFNRYMKAQRS